MSTVYARVPHAGDDPGGGVVGRPKWNFADCCRTHGRPFVRRRMCTDQHSNRRGIEGANSVALGTVLRYREILPQRGAGIRGGDSARPCEGSDLQPARPSECLSAEKRRNGHCRSFYGQSRKSAEGGRDQTYKNFPSAVKAESVPMVLTATPAGATLPHSAGHEMDDGEKRRVSRLDEFNALRRTQFKTKQRPKGAQAVKERNPMQRKWLELPWSNKPDGLSASGDRGGDENSNGEDEKENLR